MFRMGTLLILLLAATAFAQEEPLFRAGVSLVKIDLQVTEGGHPLPGLSRDDFLVFDEGLPRTIIYFAQENEPLWILLLLDVSGSMKKHVRQVAQASRQALASLHSGDRVAVMLFSRNTVLHREFTSDLADVSAGLARAAEAEGLGSGTNVNSSIIEAANYLRQAAAGEPGRRAVVILTDNGGLNYQTPNDSVIRALYEADAVLNAIAAGDARPPEPPRRGQQVNPDFTPSDVFLLARETGGEVIQAKNAGTALRDLMERARSRYSLHYHPPEGAPGSFREVRVELTPDAHKRHPRAVVSSRTGYFVPRGP